MKIAFRVDAGKHVGLGHLMRCMALAEALKTLQCECLFLANEAACATLQRQQNIPFEHVCVPLNRADSSQIEWISRFVVESKVDLLILDGYHFSDTYRLALSRFTSKLLVIDDNNDVGKLYADIVLNPSACGNDLDYQSTLPNATIIAGSRYCLLRPEFDGQPICHFPQRNRLLLTFGGSDPRHLTGRFLDGIDTHFTTSLAITVVTGPLFKDLDSLRKKILKSPHNIEHHHAVRKMAHLYNSARLAISAAGSSLFELAAMATPSILAVIADNQFRSATEGQKSGWCRTFDLRDARLLDQRIDDMLATAQTLWKEDKPLQAMHEKAPYKLYRGGANRAAQKIIQSVVG